MATFISSVPFTLPTYILLLLKTINALPFSTPQELISYPRNGTQAIIHWFACPSELGDAVQCGNLSVPINWDEPSGEHFDVGMVKLPAMPSNTTSRIGSLFMNPGGPGGSATELVASIAATGKLDEAFRASFDIIGLDPRGVGKSKQIQCDMSIYAERVSLFPETDEELDTLIDKNRRLGESCRNLTGPLFEHLDTISTAKDHEAVRIALGDEPINFLGLSYGSQLGAQYATLFPHNIRTLVLDGILQHSQSEAANELIESSSYELVLHHFFAWAAKDNSSVLQGQDIKELWKTLLANATTTPIPASLCNGTNCHVDVTAEELLFNAQQYLTFAGADRGLGSSWELFASALKNASQGDASAFSTNLESPENIAFLGIACLDWTHSDTTLASIRAKQKMAMEYSPLTRGASQTWTLQHACLGWPALIQNPPGKLDVRTDATILLASSTADPSTGLPWALGMMEELHNAVLVLREGDGHTSFLLGGETQKVIAQYLITGEAPEAGLVTHS